ncbi:hypothetical protein GF420_03425 [candidate division GN15 bacterium]|nr:hypothetical protein [candidate division GN15 bacterium]
MTDGGNIIKMPTEVKVSVGGHEISLEISSIELNQYIDRHHELIVTVILSQQMTDNQEMADIKRYLDMLGQTVSLSASSEKERMTNDEDELQFVGIVTNVEAVNEIDGTNVVRIHGSSPTVRMDGGPRIRTYQQNSPADIVESIVSSAAVTRGKLERFGSKREYTLQYNQSDYEFLMRLATGHGMFAYYDGKEFHVGKPTSKDAVELNWRQSLAGFSVDLGTAPGEYAVGTYDYAQNKTFLASSTKSRTGSAVSGFLANSPKASKNIFGDEPGYMVHVTHSASQSEATDAAVKAKSRALGRMIVGKGTSYVPSVRVGRCVQVKGMVMLDGMYLVSSVKHRYESGGYYNTFECTPLDLAFPQFRGHRDKITDLHVAVVQDVQDPEKLGRVKIYFPWLDIDSVWARMAVPHAGQSWGWVCLPEIDDEVLVGFDRGDPEQPVILGALYNSKAKPPSEATASPPEVKVLQTKGGNKILLSDKQGSEEIILTTRDGQNNIVLSMSGPGITIESKGDLTFKGKGVSIEGDTIKLKSQKDTTVEAGGNLKAEGKMNLETKAGMNYQAEGMMVKIKGQMINLN